MKADKYEKLMSKRSSNKEFKEFFEDGWADSELSSMTWKKNLDMGLAPGGKMQQEIYEDKYGKNSWDLKHSSRCFVHINNSHAWQSITGEELPGIPLTAKEYSENGMPWFDYYDEKSSSLGGSKKLSNLKSITEKAKEIALISGGNEALLKNASKALEDKKFQWALELSAYLKVLPVDQKIVKQIRIEALTQLGRRELVVATNRCQL